MKDPQRHLPSVLGCAFGFCAGGCGVGSIIGTGLSSTLYPIDPDQAPTNREKVMHAYGGIYWGVAFGMLLGTIVGILYAKTIRHLRSEELQ
jgi:uncharacterized membrane protein YfcA